MLTFLKKLGAALAKGLIIATEVGPIIQPFLGSAKAQAVEATTVNDLTQISQVVTSAEALIQAPGSGAQKLAASTPLVLSILQTSQAFDGKKIVNMELAIKAAGEITSGTADFMNALGSDQVKLA
jgi:hypothetical protein